MIFNEYHTLCSWMKLSDYLLKSCIEFCFIFFDGKIKTLKVNIKGIDEAK